jgi:hypothetical protein
MFFAMAASNFLLMINGMIIWYPDRKAYPVPFWRRRR